MYKIMYKALTEQYRDLASRLQETAKHIRGIRQWVTNEYAHSGIRDDGARIFEQLLAMARGSIPLC